MESSTNWQQDSKGILGNFYKNRAKISNWAGVVAMQNLRANSQEQLKNQEAESSWVRRHLWGASEGAGGESKEADDDMGHTILGDINNPAPIILPPQPSSSLPTVLAALGMLAAGGLAGYLLSRPAQPAPAPIQGEAPSFDDSSLSIGLGRIEDYIAAEPQGQ